MGIRFSCPNGHKLHVKAFLAGKRAICPQCGAKVIVPNSPDLQTSEVASPPGKIPANTVGTPTIAEIHSLADTGSQSIIIAIADSEAIAPQPPDNRERADPIPPSPSPTIPETFIAAATPPTIVTASVDLPPDGQYKIHRERNRRNQVTIAVVLLVLVIILAVALIWVLSRDVGQQTGGLAQLVQVNGYLKPHDVAVALDHWVTRTNLGVLRQ